MIANSEEFELVLGQLGRVNKALESLRAAVQRKNPRNFAILAESYIADRDQLFAELDRHLEERESARRGELLFRVLDSYPWLSKQSAARLAAIDHLAIATQPDGFPGGVEAFSAMMREAMRAALLAIWETPTEVRTPEPAGTE